MKENPIERKPIYVQLTEHLQGRIDSGEFQPGDQFLTERAIASEYNISRVTANKALSALVSAGVLDFQKGVGTFVKKFDSDGNRGLMASHFYSSSENADEALTAATLKSTVQPSARVREEIRKLFSIGTDDIVYYVESLRSRKHTPCMLEYRYINPRYPFLSKDKAKPLSYEDFQNIRVDRFHESCEIVRLKSRESTLLQVKPKDPAFLITTISYDKSGLVVWYGQTYIVEGMHAFLLDVEYGPDGASYGKLSFDMREK